MAKSPRVESVEPRIWSKGLETLAVTCPCSPSPLGPFPAFYRLTLLHPDRSSRLGGSGPCLSTEPHPLLARDCGGIHIQDAPPGGPGGTVALRLHRSPFSRHKPVPTPPRRAAPRRSGTSNGGSQLPPAPTSSSPSPSAAGPGTENVRAWGSTTTTTTSSQGLQPCYPAWCTIVHCRGQSMGTACWFWSANNTFSRPDR